MAGPVRILYVDDDTDYCEVAAVALEREYPSFEVHTETSVEDGLAHLDGADVDCVVSDYRLPGRDGLDFLEAVRERDPELPFVLVTGKGSEAVASEAISAGVTDYVRKSGADHLSLLGARVANAVAHRRAETRLAESRTRYEHLVEQNISGIYVIEGGEFEYVNPRFAEMFGYTPGELLSGMTPADLVADRDWEDIAERLRRLEAGETEEVQATFHGVRADGAEVVLEGHGKRTTIDGETAIIGTLVDVTERERMARDLAESERKFRAVFEEAFDAILVADDDGEFVDANPAACELFGLPEEELLGHSIADFAAEDYDFESMWEAFQRTDRERGTFPLVRPDGSRRTVEYAATTDVLPGFHLSVLRDVTERRERRRELEERRDRLDSLNRINSILRDVNRELVEARTRTDIERAVCEQFVARDPFRFAWVGVYEPDAGSITPQTWVGDGQGFLDQFDPGGAADGDEAGVFRTAIAEGTARLVSDVRTDPRAAPWRDAALTRGFESASVVPLTHGGTCYGVLAVYADNTEGFAEIDVGLLTELGRTVGHALSTDERKRAFMSNRTTELDLSVTDTREFFVRLSDHLGSVSLERMTVNPDGSYRFVVEADADADAVREAGDRFVSIRDAAVEEPRGESVRAELTVEQWPLAALLPDYGAVVRSVVAEDGRVDLRVELPESADAGEFHRQVQQTYADVELRAKRERASPASEAAVSGVLTERQQEVLTAAYRAGYFETPSRKTGVEIAESLGISQPTFHEHLRAAQRNLFREMFE